MQLVCRTCYMGRVREGEEEEDWPMGAVMLDIHASVALCFKQFDMEGRI